MNPYKEISFFHFSCFHPTGIRRAKFLTKPIPQEAEGDISCRHDLSGNSTTGISVALPIVSSSAGSICSGEVVNEENTAVDIMEDEEENEQNRIG